MTQLNPHLKETTLEDTPIDWYDFGGGFTIAPNPEGEGNMVALHCIRDGKLYYKTVYGNFKTEADLAAVRPALEASFIEELSTTQGTK